MLNEYSLCYSGEASAVSGRGGLKSRVYESELLIAMFNKENSHPDSFHRKISRFRDI
jgi:hypothetical protein